MSFVIEVQNTQSELTSVLAYDQSSSGQAPWFANSAFRAAIFPSLEAASKVVLDWFDQPPETPEKLTPRIFRQILRYTAAITSGTVVIRVVEICDNDGISGLNPVSVAVWVVTCSDDAEISVLRVPVGG